MHGIRDLHMVSRASPSSIDISAEMRLRACTHSLPGSRLLFVPNPGCVRGEVTGVGCNIGCFGDEKSAGNRGALGIVSHPEIGMDVFVVRPTARERREDDAMAEGDVANLDRLEEGRLGFVDCSHDRQSLTDRTFDVEEGELKGHA